MREIKVFALTFGPRNYWSARYRTYAFGQYLSRFGFHFTYCPLCWQDYADGLLPIQGYSRLLGDLYYYGWARLRRTVDLIRSKLYDVVILQRHLFPGGDESLEYLLEALDLRIVYDFDDAIFTVPPHLAPKDWKSNPQVMRELRKTRRLIDLSSHVVAGNDYLGQYASRFNRNVSIVPTPVDSHRLQLGSGTRRRLDIAVIGWMGTSANLYYLEQLKPVFTRLARKHAILLKIVCSQQFEIKGVRVARKDWREEDEYEDISSFDIAVMPLTDDEWTRGKCGYKLLKYMSVGVPSVASAVGMNNDIITDGVNGFLARTEDEWVEKLSILIDDWRVRSKFRLEARSKVQAKYSYDAVIPRFGEVLRQVADS